MFIFRNYFKVTEKKTQKVNNIIYLRLQKYAFYVNCP